MPYIILIITLLSSIFFGCERPKIENTQTKPDHKNIASQQDLQQITYKQVVYAPVYSDIYHYDEKATIPLSATLSIRNTDRKQSLYIYLIDYYDTDGNLIRKYLSKPIFLKPLQTDSYVVEFSESKGGTGANFIIELGGKGKVTPPLIETIMISTQNNMGISFVSQSKIIEEITIKKQNYQ
jgi:hypothetical protein